MDAVLVELGPAGTPCWLSSAWRRPSLPYGYEQSAPTRGGRLTPRRHASGPGAGRERGRERGREGEARERAWRRRRVPAVCMAGLASGGSSDPTPARRRRCTVTAAGRRPGGPEHCHRSVAGGPEHCHRSVAAPGASLDSFVSIRLRRSRRP